MAVSVARPKKSGGSLTNGSTTLFTAGTAPADGGARVVGRLTLTNTDNADRTVRIVVDGVELLWDFAVPANDVYTHPENIILDGGEIITGLASVTTVVKWHFNYLDFSDS
jgi:hypothetical protein